MKEELAQKQTSRERAIEAALSQIEKQFGKGAVMKLGQKEAAIKVPAIPTGSIAFDLSLGIGGFPHRKRLGKQPWPCMSLLKLKEEEDRLLS